VLYGDPEFETIVEQVLSWVEQDTPSDGTGGSMVSAAGGQGIRRNSFVSSSVS